MIFITGGRAQGKSAFARENYGEDAVLTDGLQDIIKGWLACLPENYIDDMINKGIADKDEAAADILSCAFMLNVLNDMIKISNNAVIICDEVGCGIVPLDRAERLYRDVTGRVCCDIAARADSVFRVHCGIGVKIK